mgnify:CR=1 FL=1
MIIMWVPLCLGLIWNAVTLIKAIQIIYNYPLKGRWIVVDIYPDAKRRGIYPLLFTEPEGGSGFSIYQIRWIKKMLLQFLLLKLSRNDAPFFSRFVKQWIFRVMGANQNTYHIMISYHIPQCSRISDVLKGVDFAIKLHTFGALVVGLIKKLAKCSWTFCFFLSWGKTIVNKNYCKNQHWENNNN